jgi:hypothetical protein
VENTPAAAAADRSSNLRLRRTGRRSFCTEESFVRKPWFLLLVLLALVAGACGGDDGGETAATTTTTEAEEEVEPADDEEEEVEEQAGGQVTPAFLRTAAQKTVEAGTGKMEMVIELTGIPGAPGAVEMTATGSFDTENELAAMTMDMSALFDQMGGTEEERAQFEQIFGGGQFELVTQGTKLFMRMPFLAQMFGSDKEWIMMDVTAAGGQGTSMVPGLGSAGTGNPAAMLESLRGVSDDIEKVGSAEVRGETTTHLRGTLNMQKALEQVPAEQRAQAEQALSQFGSSDIPYEVFVDGEGLVRRYVMDLSGVVDGAAGAEGAAGAITIDFFDFGTPVDITLPGPDEFFDATEQMGAFAGGAAQG